MEQAITKSIGLEQAITYWELLIHHPKCYPIFFLTILNKGSEFETWAFVAHQDDKIIGAIKGDIMWNVVHIDLLMIHPDYRKEGIGSKLYNLAIEHGKKAKCKMATVETFNFQAPEYWESK